MQKLCICILVLKSCFLYLTYLLNRIPTYLEEFPGLVHFIYVDRTAGQMIAPSLNVTESSASELGKGPIAHLIKNKVCVKPTMNCTLLLLCMLRINKACMWLCLFWTLGICCVLYISSCHNYTFFVFWQLWGLVATTRHYLQKGYTTVTLRDGDFYFCYFLWFENETVCVTSFSEILQGNCMQIRHTYTLMNASLQRKAVIVQMKLLVSRSLTGLQAWGGRYS